MLHSIACRRCALSMQTTMNHRLVFVKGQMAKPKLFLSKGLRAASVFCARTTLPSPGSAQRMGPADLSGSMAPAAIVRAVDRHRAKADATIGAISNASRKRCCDHGNSVADLLSGQTNPLFLGLVMHIVADILVVLLDNRLTRSVPLVKAWERLVLWCVHGHAEAFRAKIRCGKQLPATTNDFGEN